MSNDGKTTININGGNVGNFIQGDDVHDLHIVQNINVPQNASNAGTLRGSIFISYRRSPSRALVEALYQHLSGYFESPEESIFLDVKSLGSGQFPDDIRDAVRRCDVFISVISEGTFDRIAESGDWVHEEIKEAFNANRAIVLLMEENVPFPSTLPSDIQDLSRWNGMRLRYEMFEACVKHLVEKFIIPRLT